MGYGNNGSTTLNCGRSLDDRGCEEPDWFADDVSEALFIALPSSKKRQHL